MPRWRTVRTVGLLLILPVLTGVAVAKHWDAEGVLYDRLPIIATLYIAIAVDFFTAERRLWEGGHDHVLVPSLLGLSSLGLSRACADSSTAAADTS